VVDSTHALFKNVLSKNGVLNIIAIMEVKSWDGINKAEQRSNELFEKYRPTKKSMDAFNKAYSKYFTGKHPDEIYREVVFNK